MSWLSGYGYCKQITINGSSAGAQSDYQLKLTVHKGSGSDSEDDVYLNNHCQDDFDDIRFTKSDGETELDHWRESYVSGDYAVFWVEFDSIPISPNTATFYMYYGNDEASSDSDGDNTWEFFSDAEEAADLDDWSAVSGCSQIERSTDQAKNGIYSFMNDEGLQSSKHTISESSSRRVLFWFYDVAGTTGNGPIVKADDDSTFCMIGFNYYTSTSNYAYRIGGTFYDSGIARGTGAWHLFEFRFTTGNVKGFIDGVQIFSVSEPDTVSFLAIGTYWPTFGHNGYFDDICVGKFVDPEPTWGAWGSEETPAGGARSHGYIMG